LGVVSSGDASDSGDVVLSATASLDAAPGLPSGTTNVTGNNVTLSSATGEVGTAAAPLVIQASGVVEVAALMDIGLTQAEGDLTVDHIVSTIGNVTVDVPSGAIINASGTAWADEVGDTESQAIWQNLGLTSTSTSTTPSPTAQQAITAFENEVVADYAAYWQLLGNGSVQNGVFTLGPREWRSTLRRPAAPRFRRTPTRCTRTT
jgi:hypothetical protein